MLEFGDASPDVCSYYLSLSGHLLGNDVSPDCVYIIYCLGATFWEIAAHSVDHMFSLYFDFVFLIFKQKPRPDHNIRVSGFGLFYNIHDSRVIAEVI